MAFQSLTPYLPPASPPPCDDCVRTRRSMIDIGLLRPGHAPDPTGITRLGWVDKPTLRIDRNAAPSAARDR